MRPSYTILQQTYIKERLESSWNKLYGRNWDIIKQYIVSLSRMLSDILKLDHVQWHPQYAISQLRILRSGLHLVTYV